MTEFNEKLCTRTAIEDILFIFSLDFVWDTIVIVICHTR